MWLQLGPSKFLTTVLMSCFHFHCCLNSSTSFFNKLNSVCLSVSIILSILLSFLWKYADLLLSKDFSCFNYAKLLIWFSSFFVAFLTNPYNFRHYSNVFLTSSFSRAIWSFCHLIWLSLYASFLFIFLSSCFDSLHFSSFFSKLYIVFSPPANFVSLLFNSFLRSCFIFISPWEKCLHILVYHVTLSSEIYSFLTHD